MTPKVFPLSEFSAASAIGGEFSLEIRLLIFVVFLSVEENRIGSERNGTERKAALQELCGGVDESGRVETKEGK